MELLLPGRFRGRTGLQDPALESDHGVALRAGADAQMFMAQCAAGEVDVAARAALPAPLVPRTWDWRP